MRDRLPDLLHERLDTSARALVAAHVADCVDCRAELTLLREARVALASGMVSVDVTTIARLVVERTRTSSKATMPGQAWMNWRIAASIVLLAVGAGTFVAIRGGRPTDADRRSGPVPSVVARAPNGGTTTPSASQPIAHLPAKAAAPELTASGGVSELSEVDLRALLNELDRIDAVPSMEPEPVGVRVALPGTGSSE
jgi:hypothetical protein